MPTESEALLAAVDTLVSAVGAAGDTLAARTASLTAVILAGSGGGGGGTGGGMGATGATGPAGPTGPAGATGPAGPAGAGIAALPAPLYMPTLESIDECRITSGPMKDGYLVAPNGYLNVYFAGLALLGVVEERPAETKAWLNLVLNTLCVVNDGTRGQYVIYDRFITPTITAKDPDSNDSYAAVTNTLAYEYARTSGDWTWYTANITRLKDIAYYNLIVPTKPGGAAGAGMARTFQTSAWGPYYGICLTEDNCEVYQGLDALSRGCAAISLTADATYYAAARDGLGASMNNITTGVWDETNKRWLISDGRDPWTGSFYADAVTQVFPEIYGVKSGSAAVDRQRYDWGWAALNTAMPKWETTKYDDFPWMLLAYAAALRGAWDMAEDKMNYVRRTHTRGEFGCAEAGWQRRTERLLLRRGLLAGQTVNAPCTDLASAVALINQLRKTLLANGICG